MARQAFDFLGSDSIVSLLRSLGLTKYEMLAYLTLLKDGPQSCKSLTFKTEIPTGKVYTVIKKLAGEGWVRISYDERPKILYAMDPEVAIKKRILELKEKLDLLEINANRVSSTLKPFHERCSSTNGYEHRGRSRFCRVQEDLVAS